MKQKQKQKKNEELKRTAQILIGETGETAYIMSHSEGSQSKEHALALCA